MTVARALDIYLAEVVPHLKSGAFEPPKADSLKKRLGGIALSALTTMDLARYRDARLTDHVRRGAGVGGGGTVDLIRTVAPQTVKHDLGLLNRALAHVEHEQGINPGRWIREVRTNHQACEVSGADGPGDALGIAVRGHRTVLLQGCRQRTTADADYKVKICYLPRRGRAKASAS